MQRQWIVFILISAVAVGLTAGLSYAVYGIRTQLVSGVDTSLSQSNNVFNTLVVNGNGFATADPDKVKISLGIITQAKTSEEANSQNAHILSQLLSRLANAGIPKNHVETSAYNIYPIFEYPEKGQAVLVGYRAEHQILVTVVSAEVGQLGVKSGEVIDLAVSVGVNQVYGIQFAVSDSVLKELGNLALKNAVLDAQSKAETVANTLGIKLSGVHTISENVYQPYPLPYRSFTGVDVAKVANEMVPGPYKVQVSVQVTYLISP
ncbi:MAG: SIMPL domain-containing protein, partial [Candidatus Bathyarchaeia archaeon]